MSGSLEHRFGIEWVANLPVFVLLAAAALLHSYSLDTFSRIVLEDEILEWTTFWAFVVGAFANGRLASRRLKDPGRKRFIGWWFAAGLAAFGVVVALEEISWGQRLFGYRPPVYFLTENYQQELNLHNTLGDELRQLGFLGICWGYGVLLPVVSGWPAGRDWLDRLGVVSPPIALVPSFVVTAVLYQAYPWSHTGEWAESMLGMGMLSAAVLNLHREAGGEQSPLSRRTLSRGLLIAWATPLLLGVATEFLGRASASDDPGRRAEAQMELEALRSDLGAARTRTRCGVHKRVYTMVEAYDRRHVYEGEFASLVRQGLPEERANFFLDPWNSPYWIQHICAKDGRRRALFVYSFGPNRRRESTDWEIQGDDVGAWISRPSQPGED